MYWISFGVAKLATGEQDEAGKTNKKRLYWSKQMQVDGMKGGREGNNREGKKG